MDHTIVLYILIAVLFIIVIILALCIRALYTANAAMDEDLTDVETIIRDQNSRISGINAVITHTVRNGKSDPLSVIDAENALATARAWQALSDRRYEQGGDDDVTGTTNR